MITHILDGGFEFQVPQSNEEFHEHVAEIAQIMTQETEPSEEQRRVVVKKVLECSASVLGAIISIAAAMRFMFEPDDEETHENGTPEGETQQ